MVVKLAPTDRSIQLVITEVNTPLALVAKFPAEPVRPPPQGVKKVVNSPPLLKSKITDFRSVAVFHVCEIRPLPPLSKVTVIFAALPTDTPEMLEPVITVVLKAYWMGLAWVGKAVKEKASEPARKSQGFCSFLDMVSSVHE